MLRRPRGEASRPACQLFGRRPRQPSPRGRHDGWQRSDPAPRQRRAGSSTRHKKRVVHEQGIRAAQRGAAAPREGAALPRNAAMAPWSSMPPRVGLMRPSPGADSRSPPWAGSGPAPHWARLRERPILRSSVSTRRILTSTSCPTLTTSCGFSTFWSLSSLMWSRPSCLRFFAATPHRSANQGSSASYESRSLLGPGRNGGDRAGGCLFASGAVLGSHAAETRTHRR